MCKDIKITIEDQEVINILEAVDRVFGSMEAWELSELSHIKEGA